MMIIKKSKKSLVLLILVIILLIIGICLFKKTSNKQGLRVCPEEMIVNEMPGIDRSGQTVDDKTPSRSSYYILGGERKEVDEFDTAYIAENCTVPVTSAY